MYRSLRRVVWLTRIQRDLVTRCAEDALADPDASPWHQSLTRIINEIEGANDPHMPVIPDAAITIKGLHLPFDARPIFMSDEDVDVLVVWGNLPESIVRLAHPDPFEFPRIRHRCPEEAGGAPCYPPTNR